VVGTAVFVVVSVAVVGAAVFTLTGSGGSGDGAAARDTTTHAATSTTAARPPAGPFALTDGVNVRTGPGTNFPSLGTLEKGVKVMVVCSATGTAVNGPKGPTSTWVRITGAALSGYVTNEYVDTGSAADDPNVVPRCT